jgi:hypothetical protein
MLVFELDFRRICDCMCGGFENGLLKLLVQGLAIRIQNQKKKILQKPPREMEEGNEYVKIP